LPELALQQLVRSQRRGSSQSGQIRPNLARVRRGEPGIGYPPEIAVST